MSINRRSFVSRFALALASLGQSKPRGAVASSSTGQQVANSTKGAAGGYIRPGTIEVIHQTFDLIVVGGGISGTCAAISSARNNVKVALVHERSTLGGNSASEVRNIIEDTCGNSPWIKESGILCEIETEERTRNWESAIPEGLKNSDWDLVLYEWARREKNLTVFLNTTMREVEMLDESHILAVHAAQLGSEKGFILQAPLFLDASGDGVLAYRAGAEFRWGKEPRSEYHEQLAPEKPDDGLMGNTIFFKARDTGKPIHFKKPDWAAEFDTEQELTGRNHGFIEGGYWWIEVGSPLHPIKDSEAIKDELLRQLLGVWDHIKNHCADADIRERAKNYTLEFVGFWPYKRESRRVLGDYVLTEKDVRNPSIHNDDLAYGTWGLDIHVPGGILQRHVVPYEPPMTNDNFSKYSTTPYGIPLRSCYSRNIKNLLTVGRPISTSYVAFASSRVLATGAIVGQGVGVAAGLCIKYHCDPRVVATDHADELQQLLLRQDGSIPGIENTDSKDLARKAEVLASSEAILRFPESDNFHAASFPLGQLFPVSTERLESLELFLESTSSVPVKVSLAIRKAQHVWDFRPASDIGSATADVPPGHKGYVPFVLNLKTDPGSLYFAHIDANPNISWALFNETPAGPSLVPVGTSAADLPHGSESWRPLTRGRSFVLRVLPEQRPYGPQNVVRGTNRPDRWTNIFVSDPSQELPAWIELRFPRSVQMDEIQITFDTDANRRVSLPLFRYPECVKRYEIAVPEGSGWKTIVQEEDNYFRRRVHRVDRVSTNRLRVNIMETNGSPQARIYEVRVYSNETKS
jgi:hypothetical protein